jgi:hypothetical protein
VQVLGGVARCRARRCPGRVQRRSCVGRPGSAGGARRAEQGRSDVRAWGDVGYVLAVALALGRARAASWGVLGSALQGGVPGGWNAGGERGMEGGEREREEGRVGPRGGDG